MPIKRLSIFHKVSNLFRTSVVVAKMRKPIISKLIFLKKSRKLQRCLGSLKAGVGEVLEYRLSMDTLPATVANGECLEPSDLVDEEDSVDQRAERFIERFYQEIRLQRQELI
ncbi:hypothetical protein Peur_005663 [Populus x canadensis]